MAKNLVGKVTQVLGAVIDVHFDGDLPPILNAIETDNKGKIPVDPSDPDLRQQWLPNQI